MYFAKRGHTIRYEVEHQREGNHVNRVCFGWKCARFSNFKSHTYVRNHLFGVIYKGWTARLR